ncbi:TNF receptor-associated factor [Ooceraea biroi]|uniref:TNF receptor-associated factor n=1 Tax=Ooceraea biroi TaxID=2015173 RepID=A0A026WJH8_OOCBI|nr:TNF receptor-associated factor [Ooceraea biroi]
MHVTSSFAVDPQAQVCARYIFAQFLAEIEASVNSGDVTETQHTACTIATEEMVANARATVTTVLTGTCKAKKMDEKFASLERKLMGEFAHIKWLLHNVLEQQPNQLKNIRNANLYDVTTSCAYVSPRQTEIDKFNNTVQNLSTLNDTTSAFIYYWQVNQFNEMLKNWHTGRSMRSPIFYVGQHGYAMYLKITPKYFPDGTIFVGVGLTAGRYNSILAWPFPHRIRLEILDHSPENVREDRRSRIWDPATICTGKFWGRPANAKDNPECVGLSIPRYLIVSNSLSTISQEYLRKTQQ